MNLLGIQSSQVPLGSITMAHACQQPIVMVLILLANDAVSLSLSRLLLCRYPIPDSPIDVRYPSSVIGSTRGAGGIYSGTPEVHPYQGLLLVCCAFGYILESGL